MKKLKFLAFTTAIVSMFCMLPFSASALSVETTLPSWENFQKFDDKGMFGENGESYYLTPYGNIAVINAFDDVFSFQLRQNVNADDIFNIIKEFYPDNNLNPSYKPGDDISAFVNISDSNDKTYYTIQDLTGSKNISEISEAIKQKLTEKNLISAFYDIGQNGQSQSLLYPDYNTYSCDDISKETLEKYINENQLDFTISVETDTDVYYGNEAYVLISEHEQTLKENLEFAMDLYEELGVTPLYLILDEYSEIVGDNSFVPTSTFGTPTIMGDLNLDNESGLSDIVALTKYTASAELFPINDPTALANADANQDGAINSLDVNMLVEKALGHYENAVS